MKKTQTPADDDLKPKNKSPSAAVDCRASYTDSSEAQSHNSDDVITLQQLSDSGPSTGAEGADAPSSGRQPAQKSANTKDNWITKEEVRQAIGELTKQQGGYTRRSVRDYIGRGSMKTVNRFITEIESEQRQAALCIKDLGITDDKLIEETKRVLMLALTFCADTAQKQVNAANAANQLVLEQAEQERKELVERIDELEAAMDELAQQNNKLTRDLTDSREGKNRAEAENKELTSRCERLEDQLKASSDMNSFLKEQVSRFMSMLGSAKEADK